MKFKFRNYKIQVFLGEDYNYHLFGCDICVIDGGIWISLGLWKYFCIEILPEGHDWTSDCDENN